MNNDFSRCLRIWKRKIVAVEKIGYSTSKGMELATLRTRRPKQDARLSDLIKHWQAEARALGFELGQSRQHVQTMVACSSRPRPTRSAGWQNAPSPPRSASAPSTVAAAIANTEQRRAAQLGFRLGQALRALDQPAGISGVRIKLRYRERERE